MPAGRTIIASMLTMIQTLVCGSGARRDTDFCIGTWTVQILLGVKFWGKYLPWFDHGRESGVSQGGQRSTFPDWRPEYAGGCSLSGRGAGSPAYNHYPSQ